MRDGLERARCSNDRPALRRRPAVVILTVDTGGYLSATDLMYRANHHASDAALALFDALDAGAGMSGTDVGGREWAASYDGVATTLTRASADLGGSIGAVANLLNASLLNHEGADHDAQVYPTYAGPTGDPDPAHFSERFWLGDVPSAFGGVDGSPYGWHWLAAHLQGLLWPDADVAAMRAAGAAWSRAAVALDDQSTLCAAAAGEMEVQRSPEAPVAAAAASELQAHCLDLASALTDVGIACREHADQVESHRQEVLDAVHELVTWTVVDQVTGAALSLFTGGGSEVAAQLVESGIMARYAARVMSILRRLAELARAGAALIGRSLARIRALLARLRVFLSVKAVRALEQAGTDLIGRRAAGRLSPDVQRQVEEAIERARTGKTRFFGRDGKDFDNSAPLFQLPPGRYREWTAAANGSPKGAHRVIVEGDPAHPRAIYYWDHVHAPVRIGP